MTTTPSSARAFPSGDFTGCEPGYGMTLRDWFAGQFAMVAAVDGLKGYDHICDETKRRTAAYAYELADAMMTARAPQEPQP